MYRFRIPRGLSTLVLAAGVTAIGACGDDNDPAAPDVIDGDIVAVALALNNAAILTSETADTRVLDEAVGEYAERMITDHTAAAADLEALGIDPRANGLSQRLDQTTELVVAELNDRTGAEYDEAYVGVQVDLHTEALIRLDQELIPLAEDEALITYLEDLRAAMSADLELARELEAELTAGTT